MYHLFFMVTHKAWKKNLLIKYLCPRDFSRGEMEEIMKKRKIRYDRILLPILILCVIIFGISSCHKTEETKIQSKPIHTTTDFLKNALKPVGQTLYIYGGGWNEAQTGSGTEALTLGFSKEWKSFYDTPLTLQNLYN